MRQVNTGTASRPQQIRRPRTRYGVVFAEHFDKSRPTHANAADDGSLGVLLAMDGQRRYRFGNTASPGIGSKHWPRL